MIHKSVKQHCGRFVFSWLSTKKNLPLHKEWQSYFPSVSWKLKKFKGYICTQFMFDLVDIGSICHHICLLNISALFIHTITWLQPHILHLFTLTYMPFLKEKSICHPSTQTRDYWGETDYVVCPENVCLSQMENKL